MTTYRFPERSRRGSGGARWRPGWIPEGAEFDPVPLDGPRSRLLGENPWVFVGTATLEDAEVDRMVAVAWEEAEDWCGEPAPPRFALRPLVGLLDSDPEIIIFDDAVLD